MRIPIRQWRVCEASPSGLQLWFDPRVEFPRLYVLGDPLPEERVPAVRESDATDGPFGQIQVIVPTEGGNHHG